MALTVVQITDTHNSAHGGDTNENLVKTIEFVNGLNPDLIVHTGDVSILDPDNAADRAEAKKLLAGFTAPLRVLPGNHDVGEPGEQPFGGASVTSERVAAFREVFGEDRWVEKVDDFRIIGFNSELMGSGLPEEEEQWAWLESLPLECADAPVILFCLKPVYARIPEQQVPALAFGQESLDRFRPILEKLNVQMLGSGHLHHFATSEPNGIPAISAPSTAFVHRGAAEVLGPGLSQLGVVEYQLGEDGSVLPFFRARPDLVEAEALEIETFRIALDEMGVELPVQA
ncbi:metallophosphoesterase family protein [Brevibacterium samyangense]|uniref:Metallophosphoesterase n=1 Tax=Brevibacterium samyangense TaxID=366888 RepID=A0ABP5F193_9MICO